MTPPPRLFPIFARKAPVVVIFRRGPGKWVRLCLWHTDTDVVERGHWFHGRIYERRCDLSPDGTKLIYFASKFNEKTLEDREYTYAWTAICRPPWLTALALWPKGDCWHGGGVFLDDNRVLLNHRPDDASPHPDHLPKGVKVTSDPRAHGENDPVYSRRLERDGWRLAKPWKVHLGDLHQGYTTTQPEIRVKDHHTGEFQIRLSRNLSGYKYSETFELYEPARRRTLLSGGTSGADWVDWDQAGRLALFREGKLVVAELDSSGAFAERELADFCADRPEPIDPPEWATRW